MAATEQFYRNQKTLDVVFGVSCVLMLLTALWMFAQDFNREFKTEQRQFRNVQEAMDEHMMLAKMPKVAEINLKRMNLRFAREELSRAQDEFKPTKAALDAQRDKQDTAYRLIKAEYDSKTSYYNIAIEHLGKAEGQSRNSLQTDVDQRATELKQLETRLAQAQADLDATNLEIRRARGEVDDPEQPASNLTRRRMITIKKPTLNASGDWVDALENGQPVLLTKTLVDFEEEVKARETDLKNLTKEFDRYAKLATKGWKSGDTFRSLPILDAFESPTKVQQVWLPDLTIDYSFKEVPRFDRCVSCHLGIDRTGFERTTLESLRSRDRAGAMEKELKLADLELRKRQASGESLGFSPDDLPRKRRGAVWTPAIYLFMTTLMIALMIGGLQRSVRTFMAIMVTGTLLTVAWGVFLSLAAPQDLVVETVDLTKGQVTEFCVHPRLDLFVDANSPHPKEKFGCTICHGGQGSATDFNLASHTPPNAEVAEEWKKEHGWASNHFWDYPMLSSRFVESSCVKCHHQVTDLIRYGNKDEAKKVVHGYNLVRELGCFGCHEISGLKSGREIGPDLRLEPTPPLPFLSAAEQEKAKSDPLNPPGTFRKVGPSLRRIAEKTNQEWVRKWINLPRGFRPDTRMPHFYNLSTNTPPPQFNDPNAPKPMEELPEGQARFPAIEINSIAAYLFMESRGELRGIDVEQPEYRQNALHDLLLAGPLSEPLRKELEEVSARLVAAAKAASPGKKEIEDLGAELKKAQERLQKAYPEAGKPMTREAQAEVAFARKKLSQTTQHLRDAVRGGPMSSRQAFERRQQELHAILLMQPLDDRLRKELTDVSRRVIDIALLSAPLRQRDINALAVEQNRLQDRLQELHRKKGNSQAPPLGYGEWTEQDTQELAQAQKDLVDKTERLIEAGLPVPLTKRLVDEHGGEVALPPPGDPGIGRRLFTEKGCLACHVHSGTEKKDEGKNDTGSPTPAVTGEADFGPNLSRLKAKISPEGGDESAKRRWLIQWVMNPNIHHPRTRMPITHLEPEQASHIAAWLLSQDTNWKGIEPATKPPTTKEYLEAARMYLSKSVGMTARDVDDFLGSQKDLAGEISAERLAALPGISQERLAEIRRLSADADELRLEAPITEDKLKWYIGRKVVGRSGCYACHDLPGYEPAKPIGTALNDWGKKDPERLAFEDADVFVKNFYHEVPLRDDPKDPHRPAGDWTSVNGKLPIEKMFADAVEHHHREGFLHLKLMEPRSYDYHRRREWWDRLRMPQFRFSRAHRRDGESPEDFEKRMDREARGEWDALGSFEEAQAREAVMTFILGLTAENIPAKYLPQPSPDRMAEIKGRQVIDKFNCAGCHQVRPGILEFQTPGTLPLLEATYQREVAEQKPDFHFPNSNAWVGAAPTTPDRLTAVVGSYRTATADDDIPGAKIAWLSEALRFTGKDGLPRNVPAGIEVTVRSEDVVEFTEPYGGTFANLMVGKYLPKKDSSSYKLNNKGDNSTARSVVPPPLVREGERVQPNWLYGFLLNPEPIRPIAKPGEKQRPTQLLLRMPKFNMSDEDARTIVDYFTGAARLTNPGAGVTAQYLAVPQQGPGTWRQATKDYVARLKQRKQYDPRLKEMKAVWEVYLNSKVAEAKVGVQAADAAVKEAKTAADAADQAVKDAKNDDEKKAKTKEALARKVELEGKQKELTFREANLKNLEQNGLKELQQSWETETAYATDGYRIITQSNTCTTCHNVGGLLSEDAKGPNLALAASRLRPEWVEQWVANPRRLFPYDPAMPQNIHYNDRDEYQSLFIGEPLDKLRGVRDALMDLPRLADLPVAQLQTPTATGGGK
jgi:cbb3-type cytochrome oxidase cytochrome c subunit/mono/diheme cytochrome c family protein